MDLAQLEAGIAAYLDNEVIPAMKGPATLNKVAIGAVIAQAKSSGFINRYFEQMADNPMLVSLGIMTEDGQLGDVDTICDSLRESFTNTGEVEIPLLNMKFSAADVDSLRQYLKAQS